MEITREGNDVLISNEWSWGQYTIDEAREFCAAIQAVIAAIEEDQDND